MGLIGKLFKPGGGATYRDRPASIFTVDAESIYINLDNKAKKEIANKCASYGFNRAGYVTKEVLYSVMDDIIREYKARIKKNEEQQTKNKQRIEENSELISLLQEQVKKKEEQIKDVKEQINHNLQQEGLNKIQIKEYEHEQGELEQQIREIELNTIEDNEEQIDEEMQQIEANEKQQEEDDEQRAKLQLEIESNKDQIREKEQQISDNEKQQDEIQQQIEDIERKQGKIQRQIEYIEERQGRLERQIEDNEEQQSIIQQKIKDITQTNTQKNRESPQIFSDDCTNRIFSTMERLIDERGRTSKTRKNSRGEYLVEPQWHPIEFGDNPKSSYKKRAEEYYSKEALEILGTLDYEDQYDIYVMIEYYKRTRNKCKGQVFIGSLCVLKSLEIMQELRDIYIRNIGKGLYTGEDKKLLDETRDKALLYANVFWEITDVVKRQHTMEKAVTDSGLEDYIEEVFNVDGSTVLQEGATAYNHKRKLRWQPGDAIAFTGKKADAKEDSEQECIETESEEKSHENVISLENLEYAIRRVFSQKAWSEFYRIDTNNRKRVYDAIIEAQRSYGLKNVFFVYSGFIRQLSSVFEDSEDNDRIELLHTMIKDMNECAYRGYALDSNELTFKAESIAKTYSMGTDEILEGLRECIETLLGHNSWLKEAIGSEYKGEAEEVGEQEEIETNSESEENNMARRDNTGFDVDAIVEIGRKIKDRELTPDNEQATKQWLVMPVLVALGYNPFSSDIVPEFNADVGVKKGEKVDYALQINNQPIALIECKQLDVQLNSKHVTQLYRYFAPSEVRIAILTNGDEYWFFTDSKKENIMDLEPYFRIILSKASKGEILQLEQYCKDKIQQIDVSKVVQQERLVSECKELAHGLRVKRAPEWLIQALAERSELKSVDRYSLAEILYTEIEREFSLMNMTEALFSSEEEEEQYEEEGISDYEEMTLGEKMKASKERGFRNRSNIRLNHEYVYNDYSDGVWTHHVLDYARILGVKYLDISGRSLLTGVITELIKQKRVTREQLLSSERFNGGFKISDTGDFSGAHYLERYKLYVGVKLDIGSIVKFIHELLEEANMPDNSVIVSFKD